MRELLKQNRESINKRAEIQSTHCGHRRNGNAAEKTFSTSGAQTICKNIIFSPYLSPCTKMNSKWWIMQITSKVSQNYHRTFARNKKKKNSLGISGTLLVLFFFF